MRNFFKRINSLLVAFETKYSGLTKYLWEENTRLREEVWRLRDIEKAYVAELASRVPLTEEDLKPTDLRGRVLTMNSKVFGNSQPLKKVLSKE